MSDHEASEALEMARDRADDAENEVLRSNSDHLSSENASLARQVESMAMRIESLAEELAKPEDVRLREVLDALDGRAVIFDGLGERVGHLLDEMDEWIERAGEAERLAEERLAHANQLQADIEAEQRGRLAWRKRFGAREDETMGAFIERLATMANVVPADVHEHGWQWRPTGKDTAFAPPFGTIRVCRACGCLVAGGPTACARCAEADRLRKLFDDAGQGEHNVLALIDHYQRNSMEADERLRVVRGLLEENGCDCPCDHHPDERGPDCEVCLACRIGEAVGK